MANGKRKNWKKRLAVALAVLLFVVAAVCAFGFGTVWQLNSWEYWKPDYEMPDITPLLEKAELSDEEYETLYRQTGLTKLGIDDLRGELNGAARIKKIQAYFFDGGTRAGRYTSPIMYMDETSTFSTLTKLRDGDILVTATTVVSFWRFGHSALVVDGKNNLILESIGIGSESQYNNAEVFTNLVNFMVLRPKADEETKAQAVAYARENLVGVPYRFTVGILTKKERETLYGTQCAHLIWHAYNRFGLELDSNGGGLVIPQDIANSENVELVQAFGFDLDRLWS